LLGEEKAELRALPGVMSLLDRTGEDDLRRPENDPTVTST